VDGRKGGVVEDDQDVRAAELGAEDPEGKAVLTAPQVAADAAFERAA
jgi:hypothetical protein